jgi:DNA-binding response OmpR family regulator
MAKRLLLVEDDSDHVAILTLILENEGYEVLAAADGQEALKAVQEGEFQAIICDYMMPNLNGEQFLEELRKSNPADSLPVLMLTSVASSTAEEAFLNAGANDFCAKGSSKAEILARIKKLL